MAVMLPCGPLQAVFSFDTTGSMSGALKEVRGRLSDMLQRLQTDIPAVTTAVVAHGDYCDRDKPYLIKHIDFTNNLPQLVDFVNNVETTYGGDEPEAYEVMLRLVRKDLNWSPGSQRILVVIGDAFPHSVDESQNVDKIDWRQETLWLQEMGVRIYGVQVNTSEKSTEFFRKMTEATGGQHLKLSEFGTLCDVIMAICYREKGAEFLNNYEAEVRAREGQKVLHRDLEGVFGVLRRTDSSASSSAPPAKLTKTPSVPKLAKAPSVLKAAKKTVAMSSAKKLVARAAKTAATKPRGKHLSKSSIATRRLNREKVPDTNFRFNGLHWSPWKLVAVPAEEEVANGQWRRFLKGSGRAMTGAVLGSGLTGRGRGSVICEAAVQTRPGARRHVVWCRLLPASSASQISVCRLLGSAAVRKQFRRVMHNGCRLSVRWAKVNRRDAEAKVRQQIKDTYDYAWRNTNGHCRDVWVPNSLTSSRVQIAGPMEM